MLNNWGWTHTSISFNSLQTGRSMEREFEYVSRCLCGTLLFQFPSNGKEHGKGSECGQRFPRCRLFQFPSNGKEHGKPADAVRGSTARDYPVSIPFKREGAWKGLRHLDLIFGYNGFNSLQTGRSMERKIDRLYKRKITVSIPFKREGAWKGRSQTGLDDHADAVSIPFKREGAWKGKRNGFLGPVVRSFNSLQTGRSMERDPIFDPDGPWLQTPQNQTRTAPGFFSLKIYPENPTNPYGH